MKRQCPQCSRVWYDMGRKQECCPECCNDTENGCSGCQEEAELCTREIGGKNMSLDMIIQLSDDDTVLSSHEVEVENYEQGEKLMAAIIKAVEDFFP